MDGWTEMMKLIAAFCEYVNTPKNICKRWDYEQVHFVNPCFQRLAACLSSDVLTGKYWNFEGMWGLHLQGHAVQERFFPLVFSSVVKTSRLHVQDAYFSSFNTFTAIVDLSRSNFSIARAPLFQLSFSLNQLRNLSL